MHETMGNRTRWITQMEHWTIRMAFTLPNYRSEYIDEMLTNATRALQNSSESDLRRWLDIMYETSAHTFIDGRFLSYQSSLPPSTYRRTSIDFKMERNPDFKIGAFVRAKDSKTIWLNDGTLSAMEDASQVLFALWERPFGLKFAADATFQLPYPLVQSTTITNADSIMPLRLKYNQFKNTFVDYSAIFSKAPAIDKYAVNGVQLDIPSSILEYFLLVSQDPSRQMFADNLSQASLLWVISHEDAHRYCGHIGHFELLGLNVQDELFNELIAPFEDETSVEKRRAAELEADTCATMRTVDYCFDNEFLEVITDWMSFELREEIYGKKKRSSELEARQRLILMRFLSASVLLPLTVFDIAVSSTPSSNLNCYPPFIIRALNTIFTIASRAMDVSLNKPDFMVGQFDLREFGLFFDLALQDMANIYKIVQGVMDEKFRYRTRPFPTDLQSIATSMLQAFFLCHDQPRRVKFRNPLSRGDFANENEVVADFLLERQRMYLHRGSTFLETKKQANMSRLDKVAEDVELASKSIKIARKFYSFLP